MTKGIRYMMLETTGLKTFKLLFLCQKSNLIAMLPATKFTLFFIQFIIIYSS